MVEIYVRLILKGVRTIEEVPEQIREQVRSALDDLNREGGN